MDALALLIQVGVTNRKLDSSHMVVLVREDFNNSGEHPLVAREVVILDDYDVPNPKISLWSDPLLAQLEILDELVSPSCPKFIRQVLNLAASFS